MAVAPPGLRAIARRPSGEPALAAALTPLEREGWRIVHGVAIGSRGRLEHVAIGRAGAFTVSGHVPSIVAPRLDPLVLDGARAQAELLGRVTGAGATAVLALSRGRARVASERGVTVLPARTVADHLRRRPAALSADRVDELELLLRAAVAAHAA